MLPELTNEQRTENLRHAMVARQERADALRALKRGEMTPADGLADPRLQGCKAYRFLKALPGVGTARACDLMKRLGIAPSRRVRGLGRRQREALLEAVGTR